MEQYPDIDSLNAQELFPFFCILIFLIFAIFYFLEKEKESDDENAVVSTVISVESQAYNNARLMLKDSIKESIPPERGGGKKEQTGGDPPKFGKLKEFIKKFIVNFDKKLSEKFNVTIKGGRKKKKN